MPLGSYAEFSFILKWLFYWNSLLFFSIIHRVLLCILQAWLLDPWENLWHRLKGYILWDFYLVILTFIVELIKLLLGLRIIFFYIKSVSSIFFCIMVVSLIHMQNESRNTEMLAAACAVGVSSCFGSPIGGVYKYVMEQIWVLMAAYWASFIFGCLWTAM